MTTHKQVRSTEEALELALECAERCENIDGMYSWSDTITAIKAAMEAHKALMSLQDGAQPAVAEQHKQEPVAVVETIGGYPDESAHVAKWLVPYKSLKAGDKLYTTPPTQQSCSQRTWVGLTEEEWEELWRIGCTAADLIDAVEAKLKEKNT